MKIGIIGCGNISDIYLRNCTGIYDNIEVVGVADIIHEKALEKATIYNVSAFSVDDLISHPDIELIINLTIPKAHADISIRTLENNKHVYVEKPLAISKEDGKRILELAKEKNLLVGGAPDTFLGSGIQTCKKLIEDGWIGEPIGASAFMTCHGHENWHPDPDFFYKEGGGPMFDMGPYYLTALIALIGPIRKVTGMTRVTFPKRKITSAPKAGQEIKVDVATHVMGIMEFENGAIGSIMQSFDVYGSQLPRIEIYGTAGSMMVPDPNTFGGPVFIQRGHDKEWVEMPLIRKTVGNGRGIGVSDMIYALKEKRPHRASGDLMYHVLEVMHSFQESSDQERHIKIESTLETPKAMPIDF